MENIKLHSGPHHRHHYGLAGGAKNQNSAEIQGDISLVDPMKDELPLLQPLGEQEAKLLDDLIEKKEIKLMDEKRDELRNFSFFEYNGKYYSRIQENNYSKFYAHEHLKLIKPNLASNQNAGVENLYKYIDSGTIVKMKV